MTKEKTMANDTKSTPKKNSTAKKILNSEFFDYVMIAIGMMAYGMGWTLFLLPNDITTGGVAGISSLLYWGMGVPVQVSYFGVNALLLLGALRVLGFRFCLKTIYAVGILTLFLSFLTNLGNEMHLLKDQPFMASIIGAIFCGSGVGLGLSFNGSTGGTDIVAAIVNKYRDISLGRVILLCDIVIITCSYLVFHDWEKVIYGYVVLCVTAFCIDQVVNSRRSSVQFFIISSHYEEIARRINQEPHRGVTVLDAQGFYSGHSIKMLFVLAKKRQSSEIFHIINEVDPMAFVSQSRVIGVYGEGFDHFKFHK